MRQILLFGFLLLSAISTYSQADNSPQQCTLKLSQAPAVRGVKLGMTVDELLPLFPVNSDSAGIKDTLARAEGYPQLGGIGFGINPSNWENKERFAGITDYYFYVFDRRVVSFTVRYHRFPDGARWKNPDDLIQRFSDAFHLPGPKDWVPDRSTSPITTEKLKCDGFEVTVSGGDQGSIGFYTNSWEGIRKERVAAFEEQKRREFKP
jgi:hypothetical protein